MSSLYLLIPLSLLFVLLAAFAFWRAVQGGQFEDLERYQRCPPDE